MLWYHVVFFFKQKTAYELRISDWSSDVCSSDLLALFLARPFAGLERRFSKGIRLRHRFGHRLAGVADRRHHHLVVNQILAPCVAEQEIGAVEILGVDRRHHEGSGPGYGRARILGDQTGWTGYWEGGGEGKSGGVGGDSG